MSFITAKTSRIIWIQWLVIAALIAGFFQFRSCSNHKLEVAQSAVDSLTLANQKLDSTVNKMGQKIYTQIVTLSENQKSIRKLTDSIFNLKKRDERIIRRIVAYYTERTNVHIDSVSVPYTDSIAIKQFRDSAEFYKYALDSMIVVPKKAALSTTYFSIDETVTKNGLVINSLNIPDSQYIRIVENRGGFLRKVNGKLKFHVKPQIQIQTLHTNPYIQITGENSILYTPRAKPRILEKVLLLGIGVFVGLHL